MTPEEQRAIDRYQTATYAVNILAIACKARSGKIIDVLTGYLWDEEEAGILKDCTAFEKKHDTGGE